MKEDPRGRRPVAVRAHAGYRGEETPRSFTVDGREREVKRILSARIEEEGRARRRARVFTVRCTDGRECRLEHVEEEGAWYLREGEPRRPGKEKVF